MLTGLECDLVERGYLRAEENVAGHGVVCKGSPPGARLGAGAWGAVGGEETDPNRGRTKTSGTAECNRVMVSLSP